MIPFGKAFFLHQIKAVSGGDVKSIAAEGVTLGLSHVSVKVADGTGIYNLRLGLFDDYIPALQSALDAVGIQMTGWHYVYGDNPNGEARKSIERVKKFGLKSFIVDAEAEFKKTGKAAAARAYMDALRAGLPGVSIGVSTYRFPSYHPEFPWREFLERADYYVPQVYWAGSTNPAAQLDRCIQEYRAVEKRFALPEKPVLPAGAAYHENGWQPTTCEMDEFDARTRALDLPGVLWWEWGHAQRYGFIATIAAHPWPGVIPPAPPPAPGALMALVVTDKLNIRNAPTATATDIGDLLKGQSANVYAVRYDAAGNEWLKIASDCEKWICSVYGGKRLAELIYG